MPSEKYDEDARVLDSLSDVEPGSDSDADTLVHSPNAKDRDVLDEHDEAERLLTESSNAKSDFKRENGAGEGRGRRLHKHRRESRTNNETSNLVYEMEEGYKDTSSNSSTISLLLGSQKYEKSAQSRPPYIRFVLMSASIAALFVLLAYGAYRASQSSEATSHVSKQLSNGTHVFEATTILISLDGFRADFLQRGLTPSMNAFVSSGVSPQYMLPSFPSVTFPNHYTLVTGMYPESHGIVGNQFWDQEFQEEFYYTNTSVSMQSRWWEAAEPIWVTAEKQGIKTAIHMWPGSEAHIHNVEPTFLDKFKPYEKLPKKVDRILEFLDKEPEDRPQLIAAYVPDVDRDGHKYGPNSTEIHATIASADQMLTLLIEGLLERNLTEIVNLVVVSDHGMATMSAHRMVQLDDIIDMTLVDHIDGWPLRGLRLKDPERDVPVLYKQLSKAAEEHGTFEVYTLDTMPERYHFTNNPRIAPLWVVPRTGWLVIEREDFDISAAIAAGEEFHPRGIHGFDHEHPLMRAIFIARGPAFQHAPNSRVPVFQNIEVYNIICDSLGMAPHSNNGTIRLPMKTTGLHSDIAEPLELPKDDPADIDNMPGDATVSQNAATPASEPEKDTGSVPPVEQSATEEDAKSSWWKYVHEQLEKAKDWATEIIDSIKNNKGSPDKTDAG
ncbi:hypothetical protein OHC33_000149 [Knufia fluminis]|uniref:Uncharacterized protein n=1 Tax=Knufia fluminis TaxID=191047 RepID=A0AAN8I7K9_9EURO|nr:hypothetical protein OHC33_000149 [Knufia fluminis]